MKLTKEEVYKLQPLRDIVAFKWIFPKATKSGIVLPDTVANLRLKEGRFYFGKVLKVGPKVQQTKIGDIIFFHEYATTPFEGTYKEEEVYFIKEKDILGIIKDLEVKDIGPLTAQRLMTNKEREHLAKN